MAITALTAKPIECGTCVIVKLEFASDLADPLFRIYKDGIKVDQTRHSRRFFPIGLDESPLWHVVDDDIPLDRRLVGRWRIQWDAITDAVNYRVEEYVDAAWVVRQILRDSGQKRFEFVTRYLEDETEHQFRVIPIDAEERDGTALTITRTMVRRPNSPNATWVYLFASKSIRVNEPVPV